MTFSGRFAVTKKDNIRYHIFRLQRKLGGAAVLTFVCLTVLITLIRYLLGVTVSSALNSALIFAVAGALLVVCVNIFSAISRVNNLYKQGLMSNFTVQYTVDQSGIHAKGERGDTDFRWEQILLARETRHAFYLSEEEGRTVVIPKGQIVSNDECATLRTLLRTYVPAGRVRVGQ